jgi:replicative superfamily II helicase
MEAAIIEFCHKFPDCRVVGLSATVPNVQEIADWITTLTGAPTDVVKSDFRPVPIVEEFMVYKPFTNLQNDVEEAKNDVIMSLVNDAGKYQQQFLIAVFSKAYGRRLLEHLKSFNVAAEFHNADIGDRAKRKKIEDDFKAGRIRVLISTSTLFTGVNLPARNVIITALRAGPDMIPVYTLKQAAGRAGRPRYDTEGDVFYLCPIEELNMQKARIELGEPIRSQLSQRTFLASHIVGAIHLNRITNQNDFDVWYSHTLAFQQGIKSKEQIQAIRSMVIENLRKMGVVIVTEKYGIDYYRLSRIGTITAQMYLDPYHFVSALNAIKRYSLLNNPTENDLVKAMCMWEGYSSTPPSYEEKNVLPKDLPLVPDQFKKIAGVIKLRITGQKMPGPLTSMNAMVYNDISRMQQAVSRAVQESKAIDISTDRLDIMFTRVTACCTQEQAQLAVSKFTKKEREKLMGVGISTFAQAKGNVGLVRELIGDKRADALGITFGATKDSAGVLRFGGR